MSTVHEKTPPRHTESRPPFEEHILEHELTQWCLSITERFRKSELDKGIAMVEIAKAIGESKECTGPAQVNSISAFFKMLETERSDPGTLGSGTSQSHDINAGVEERTHSRSRNLEETLDPVGNRAREKRKRKTVDSDGGDSSKDETHKFDTSKLPWEIEEVVSPAKLRPELRRTHNLLKLYMEDIKAVKASLTVSPRRPEFPESEWDNVIRGRTVDLNKVLSAMFIIGSDSKRTEHLGSIEVRIAQGVPIKKVTTLGEWEMAWTRTSRAITYAFPHRKEELALYGEHISGLFEAISSQYHSRIILYDQSA
jgi:hypothetical protein